MSAPLLCLLALLTGPQDLLLRGGGLFDGEERVPNEGLLVRGGKIVNLEAGEAPGAGVVELEDRWTILPGFFDLHAHHAVDLFERGRVDETVAMPRIFLANGVTSAFSGGEVNPERMRELRLAIGRGELPGPRLYNSGPYFGRWRRGWRDDEVTSEQIIAEVDHWASLGVRGFKAKTIRAEHLTVLIERAHHHGLTVTGHLDSGFRGSVNPREAIHMGIDRIEHFLGGDGFPASRSAYASYLDFEADSDEFRDIARLYIEKGVYFDATMTAYGYYGERDPVVFEHWEDERSFLTPFTRELLAERPPRPPMELFERIYWHKRPLILAFVRAGGGHLVTTGSDHPSWGDWNQGFAIHRELHALVLAGLTPAEALRCATINGARALGVGDQLGSLDEGKLADLLVVAGDPLEEITATRDVRWVVRGGVLHDARALLDSARGKLGPASEAELEEW